ncbi:cupin domain-containing protein [Candidatus Woesearchaeota archaeon]|nr:cupin domain-containing protein [Candidatus Woesearchaeota archaeon]
MKTTKIVRPPESKALKSGRVVLCKGEEIGEHVTTDKEELIIVIKGKATLMHGHDTFELKQGETHFIKEGVAHNVINYYDDELEYIYVVSLFKADQEH